MNWFDSTQCKQYQFLEKIKNALLLDYEDWKAKCTPENNSIKFIHRHNEVKLNTNAVDPRLDSWLTEDLGWWVIPLVDASTIRQDFSVDWPRTIEVAVQTPGLLNMSINFLEPGCVIPDHSDDRWGGSSTAVSMIGIQIPNDNIDIVGFHAGNERKHISTGEITSFNGYKVHGAWNFSDQWRVTSVVDIDDIYWNFAE